MQASAIVESIAVEDILLQYPLNPIPWELIRESLLESLFLHRTQIPLNSYEEESGPNEGGCPKGGRLGVGEVNN